MNIDQSYDISQLVDQYLQDHETLSQKIAHSHVNQYFIEQLIQDLQITLKVLKQFLNTGNFHVQYKEKKVKNTIHDINFKGIVDRIDVYEDYVSIIDYKSSAKSIDLNLAMQRFSYSDACLFRYGDKNDG